MGRMRSNFPTSQDNILQKVRVEKRKGEDFVKTKREKFRDRIELYNNQAKQSDRIGITTLYTTMNTLLSLYYTDQLTVHFSGRELGDEEAASNLDEIAKFDQEEMDMAIVNYQNHWDRLFYGVGIRVKDGWDDNRKVPVFKSIDPLTMIPDPEGHSDISNFNYIGFEVDTTIEQLNPNMGYFNLDKIGKKQKSSESILNSERRDSARGYNNRTNIGPGDVFTIYHHFTQIGGRKYLITTANDSEIIIRFQEIEPVTDAEIKDPSLIQYPIILTYYSPGLRKDPFGVSVPDLIEDKQRAESILANLALIREKNAAVGTDYLYDVQKIRNAKSLISPSINPRMIAVNGNPQGAIAEVPRSITSGSTFNMQQFLDREVSLATGAGSVQSGVISDEKRTASEIQQTQANANLRFLLNLKFVTWAEKKFWALWYRCYQEYFSSADKKYVRIIGGMKEKSVHLKRNDFITLQDPDISIASKTQMEAEMAKQRGNFLAILPVILQDPNLPDISKTFAKRKAYRFAGMTRDDIEILAPKTADELQAWQDVELINNGEFVPVEKLDEDHLTYIVIYQNAQDGRAKDASIEARKQALRLQGKSAEVSGQFNASLAQAQAQFGNAAIQQQAQPAQGNNLIG